MKFLRKISLTSWILIGLIIGVLLGVFFPASAVKLRPVSNIFLRLIKSIIGPLLFGTLVSGIASTGELKTMGRITAKALIYFDPSQPAGSQIVYCFNSALAEPAASTPPCGFNNFHANAGINRIDFGFPVNNRFVQVTAVLTSNDTQLVVANVDNYGAGSNNQVQVHTFYAIGSETDTPFYLTVF